MNSGARRLCAVGALLAGIASVVVAVVVLWNNWAALLGALVLLVIAMMAAWYVVTRRGAIRLMATAVAITAVVIALVTLLRRHSLAGIVAVLVLVAASAVVIDVHDAAGLAQLVTLSTAGRGSAYAGWHEWTAPELEIRSGRAVDAGIDGEAVTLEAPVRLEVVRGALRVRIAPHHPGVSPATIADETQQGGVRRLVHVAFGRAGDPVATGAAG